MKKLLKNLTQHNAAIQKPAEKGLFGVTALFLIWLVLFCAAAPVYGKSTDALNEPGVMNVPKTDIIFVIDNSGSMKKNDPDFITRDVVTNFSYALLGDAYLGMVIFDQDARLLESLAREPDDRILESIKQVDYSGKFTNSPAGIERALYEFKKNGRLGSEKAIIFITDGIVDTGDKQLDIEKERWLKDELAEESRKAGIRIFGIAFTEKADFHLIQSLAFKTDGDYFRAYKAVEIPDILSRILDSLHTSQETASESTKGAGTTAALSQEPQNIPAGTGQTAMTAQVKGQAGRGKAAPAEGYHKPDQKIWETYRTELALGIAALVLVSAILLLLFFRTSSGTSAAPDLQSREQDRADPPDQSRSEAKLIDVSSASSKSDFPLDLGKSRITVGRDAGNDISIPHKTISGFHATFEFKDGYYYIEDQRSTNGTKLNSVLLKKNQPVRLKSGDRIDFSEFEFRFILLDQDPAGKTVILGSSALTPKKEDKAESESKKEDDGLAVFKECLYKHLDRVGGLGTSYKNFISQNFDEELIQTLAYKATETIHLPDDEKDEQTLTFAKSPVLYNLCALPLEMNQVADWFSKQYDGYTKYLSHFFDSDYFKENDFNVLCILVYGRTDTAWISITIVPMGDEADDIEIMSYEFLSEGEKRSLALNYDDIGRIV